MVGKNATPLVGWHPRADLVAWLESEVQRRGGGRGIRSEILDEALEHYSHASREWLDKHETKGDTP
jgi:hypothetical protein